MRNDDRAWTLLASCVGMDASLFIVDDDASPDQAAVDACETCPVRAKCLGWARQRQLAGLWGGVHLKSSSYVRRGRLARRRVA